MKRKCRRSVKLKIMVLSLGAFVFSGIGVVSGDTTMPVDIICNADSLVEDDFSQEDPGALGSLDELDDTYADEELFLSDFVYEEDMIEEVKDELSFDRVAAEDTVVPDDGEEEYFEDLIETGTEASVSTAGQEGVKLSL